MLLSVITVTHTICAPPCDHNIIPDIGSVALSHSPKVSILHIDGNDGSYYGRLWLLLSPRCFEINHIPRTLGIWTHRAQRLTRELCVTFESNSVSSSCAGQDSVASVSLVVSLSNGTIYTLSHSLTQTTCDHNHVRF